MRDEHNRAGRPHRRRARRRMKGAQGRMRVRTVPTLRRAYDSQDRERHHRQRGRRSKSVAIRSSESAPRCECVHATPQGTEHPSQRETEAAGVSCALPASHRTHRPLRPTTRVARCVRRERTQPDSAAKTSTPDPPAQPTSADPPDRHAAPAFPSARLRLAPRKPALTHTQVGHFQPAQPGHFSTGLDTPEGSAPGEIRRPDLRGVR